MIIPPLNSKFNVDFKTGIDLVIWARNDEVRSKKPNTISGRRKCSNWHHWKKLLSLLTNFQLDVTWVKRTFSDSWGNFLSNSHLTCSIWLSLTQVTASWKFFKRVFFSIDVNFSVLWFWINFVFLLLTSSFLAQMTRSIPVLKSTLNLLYYLLSKGSFKAGYDLVNKCTKHKS